ncbi:Mu transposase C-terminal domain-containing protein [Sphingomonas sp. Root1294]|uniref:Mu transposase C-terminal domain-containing protein n=2 Tax=Sphingomonas TaxID=13687 RepID=UPI001F345430|nr:Mu transposase C-terminal domain-containing protein [Sphingomonas sp. Root1294]
MGKVMADTGTTLTRADTGAWRIACDREPVIRALVAMPTLTRSALLCACAELSLSRTRVFELVARYRKDPVTTSLLDQGRGFPKGGSRLDPQLDQIIDTTIESFYLTRPKPTMAQLVRRVKEVCHEGSLKPPARGTIAARVALVERNRLVKARDGRKAASDRHRPVVGSYFADHALQVVQMDHTPADIIIVDEHFRRPLCRPTLTLQIDLATRVIPGFYISLESPSATSVGMAIRHAVLGKTAWLEEREIRLEYPVYGIPDALHLDNAREFHSHALARGCQQHGIELKYRPIATPHYGGHIERLIGTMIGEVHLLPGTTFSNVKAKGDYDAEGQSCMTLKEFELWFTLQVGIYHGSVHRELGVPPLTAWNDANTTRAVPLRLPADADRFLLDFLPFEMRRIRREGVELFHAFYWHGALAPLAANCDRKLPIKYSPLNLSSVYVELPDGEHLTVPLRDRRRPPITKFEHDLAVKALRERGRLAVDENSLFEMVREQRRIIVEAIDRTKSARRSTQRISYALGQDPPHSEMLSLPTPMDAAPPCDTEPVVPFTIEERT